MTDSAGRPGETEAVEAAYLAVSAYTPEQAVRWQNTANGIMYRREAEDAVRAAYPIIAEAVRAETADEVRALRAENALMAEQRDAMIWAAEQLQAERDTARAERDRAFTERDIADATRIRLDAELAAARDQIAARLRDVCDAMGEPYTSPGDHRMEPDDVMTWERILSLVKAGDEARIALLTRMAEADPQWLDGWRLSAALSQSGQPTKGEPAP